MSGLAGKLLAWRLYGTGLENLRKDELDIPEPRENEILVHVDAVGLCFSDLKIIRAGASHPKLWWKNLEDRPLTPGHGTLDENGAYTKSTEDLLLKNWGRK